MIEKQRIFMEADESKNDQSLFPDETVCRFMYMIMNGLHHIHENSIVHRDLKAENCLVDKKMHIKIIDFGLSKMVQHKENGQFLLGTPYYMAPEVYEMQGRNEAYRQPLDCWSAGILMYYLVSGEFPFEKPDLTDKICSEYLNFRSKRWNHVSIHAKDLIRLLLNKQPEQRLTASNSLDHLYFKLIREKKQS
jgi:serine/threonine protein kinase